jgi:hypothetical protein
MIMCAKIIYDKHENEMIQKRIQELSKENADAAWERQKRIELLR